MNRFKCTYYANGIEYNGDRECDTIQWAIKLWQKVPGFQKFGIPPYKVA